LHVSNFRPKAFAHRRLLRINLLSSGTVTHHGANGSGYARARAEAGSENEGGHRQTFLFEKKQVETVKNENTRIRARVSEESKNEKKKKRCAPANPRAASELPIWNAPMEERISCGLRCLPGPRATFGEPNLW
jgi:hypothetical protein